MKVIDYCAFANVSQYLTSIELPEGLTTLGDGAFAYCEQLETVKLPEGITHIGACAFIGCRELKSIDIPDSVHVLGDRAFCITALSTVNIGENSQLESIGAYAFFQVEIKSIFIPARVTSIGQNAFETCRNLEVINYAGTEAQWDNISKGADWDYYAGEFTEIGTYTVVYNYEFPTE